LSPALRAARERERPVGSGIEYCEISKDKTSVFGTFGRKVHLISMQKIIAGIFIFAACFGFGIFCFTGEMIRFHPGSKNRPRKTTERSGPENCFG
jgi:hypothetical protein